ncbi:MAG: mannose-1-phosphate guanylyltransferase/mannose-6-phosphate isomerase [Hydrogenophilus sp.]
MLLPVILSGGAGTRLWPVSREAHPKPFIRLPDGQSLLQKTALRAAGLEGVAEFLTVTHRDYYFQTKDEYGAVGLHHRSRFLLEPVSRNTAPAIALAALHAYAIDPETTLLVLPADHLIANEKAFRRAVTEAVKVAKKGYLVTFGITPTAPETGYGYIETGAPLSPEQLGASWVARFIEKPDGERAKAFLAAGNFYWNAGMFCFTAATLLQTMESASPDLLAGVQACWERRDPVEMPIELPRQAFETLPNISFDYAVMERAQNVAVVPCDFEWSDIGSWDALARLLPSDADGNRYRGEVELIDSRNTFVHSEHHLIAAIGVEDLIIVDTPDATLVAHRGKAQEVRRVVELLKKRNHAASRFHRTVHRPWGCYTVLEEGERFKIKRIEVKPGASLSLQMHHHRSEHWVVVSGTARITNGQEETLLQPNQSTYIPAGQKHRLENPGKIPCVLIEVQCGEYLGEDDIVRFADRYGRHNPETQR